MNAHVEAGFTYLIETVKNGVVVESETVHNLMPTEGANHILSAAFKGGSQVTTWYIGLYEGNYTPSVADIASTFPGLAAETSAYTSSTRVAWAPGTVVAGILDNSSNRAEFTFTAAKTVYGGFMSSAAGKGATTGALVSLVRFPSPRVLDADSILRVTAGITLTSA